MEQRGGPCLQQHVRHPMPEGDLALAHVVQKRGGQQILVVVPLRSQAAVHLQAVLPVAQRHRLEQPPLGLAQQAERLRLQAGVDVRPQRPEELAAPVECARWSSHLRPPSGCWRSN